MSASKSPSIAIHYLPYVVLVVLVALAIGGTRYVSNKSAPAKSKAALAEKGTVEPKVTDSEPVLGYQLPGKSHIGTIGAAKGLKATLYGRRSDVVKVVGDAALGLEIDGGLPSGAASNEVVSRLAQTVNAAPTQVGPGRVLIVLSNPKQLLKLVEEVQTNAVAGSGRVILDAKGRLTVQIGTGDGVELDATSSEMFKASFSTSGMRITTDSAE
jgi:hypothetical protein